MRRTLLVLGFVLMSVCVTNPAQAQKDQNVRVWWVGGEVGEGQLSLTSNQVRRNRAATLALGFLGGHRLGRRSRIGLELNGWLLQASNLNDPTVGESVSNVLAVGDVFPIRTSPLFVRFGTGLGMYQNNRPGGFNGTGWAWTAGLGYEIRVTEKLGLAPIVDYDSGRFGDVRNAITVETGRRYSVMEFKAAAIYHFGRSSN